jgi:hypothetical protein
VVKIGLPERVLDYSSTNEPEEETVLFTLPKDTSYAQRRYTAQDGFNVYAHIILMGADRTSIHKPDFCLPGNGWNIERREETEITIDAPQPYPMRVAKWTVSNQIQGKDGTPVNVRGLYVFWFVADNEQTARNSERMWWITRDLLSRNVLQRWAYVSYLAVCMPGQEDAAFERVKKLIAASVHEFQFPPASGTPAVAKQ